MKRLLRMLVLAFLLLAVAPTCALARSLEVGAVDIVATIQSDGSVAVVEQRTYDASGSYSGVYWDVPQGAYEGREVRATVAWVGAIQDGEQVLMEEAATEAPGTYELDDNGDHLRLKVFWPMEDETVTLQVSYELSNLALRWADVGELYWQYVQADPSSQGEWLNVSCTVRLPVPDGVAVTPGDTVRAWGHGPIDGEVGFSNDEVHFFSPGVGSAEFLEARVTFPAEWLGDAEASGEARLEGILAEEDQWAREANATRWKARLAAFGLPALMCLLGVGSLVADKLHQKVRSRRGAQATFKETYFRDVPTTDHPAVLGMLYRDGRIDGKDFSATLMRLVDEGRATMDTVEVRQPDKNGKASGKPKREWHMVLRKNAPLSGHLHGTRAGGKKIDNKAFDFLYDVVADKHKHATDPLLMGPGGEPYVIAPFFKETAKKWPAAYRSGYDAWKDAVDEVFKNRQFVEGEEEDFFSGMLMLGDIALSLALGVVCIFVGSDNLFAGIGVIVLFGCGCVLALTSDDTETVTFYSQEALEVRAKLEALRRWLVDFTRLEEAIPTDVVLWNRLIVMATALGVAEEVIRQLRVHVPEVLGDARFVGSGLYDNDLERSFLVPTVTPPVGSSSGSYHSTSNSDVARSHGSSSRGSGGGFSGGGGGGFSGGGGRGGGF